MLGDYLEWPYIPMKLVMEFFLSHYNAYKIGALILSIFNYFLCHLICILCLKKMSFLTPKSRVCSLMWSMGILHLGFGKEYHWREECTIPG